MSRGIYAPGVDDARAIGGRTINEENALNVNLVGSLTEPTAVVNRASLILTNAYVVSTGVDVRGNTQVIFFIEFTIGSLTDLDLKVEFSYDNSDWFQETFEVISNDTSTETNGIHTYATSGKYRLPVEVAGEYIRISAIGNGTVTSSLLAITMVAK